jgi:hypothetical protein
LGGILAGSEVDFSELFSFLYAFSLTMITSR